jgi:hypothetical protein
MSKSQAYIFAVRENYNASYSLSGFLDLDVGYAPTSYLTIYLQNLAPLLRLSHPLFRPTSKTPPLVNRDPVRMRGDQVFRERFRATIDDITSTDVSFSDDDFFPDISNLNINDMADGADVNQNAIHATAPYAIFFYLQFLVLEFGIDVICLSCYM